MSPAPLLAILFLLQASPEPKDLHGDPLPPGSVARMGTARLRHDSLTMSIRYSKDGSRMVTGGYDHTIRIWDTATGRETARFLGHEDAVTYATFTPAEDRIVSRCRDGSVRVWTIKGGAFRELVAPRDSRTIALSPDASLVACGTGGGKVRILAVESGDAREEFQAPGDSDAVVAFTADGKRIVAAGGEGAVAAWNLDTGEEAWRRDIAAGSINSLAASPDLRTMAAACEDKSIVVFDVATGTVSFKLDAPNPVSRLAYAPDGKSLASLTNTVTVWDLDTRKSRWSERSPDSYSVAFHPNGKVVASGGAIIALRDAQTGARVDAVESHEEWVEQLIYTPDGKRLVSSSRDRTVRTWDAATGRPLSTLKADIEWGSAMSVSRDGKKLVTVGRDYSIRQWNLDSATPEKAEVEFFEGPLGMGGISYSADGKHLIVARMSLEKFEAATGKRVQNVSLLPNYAFGSLLSPDGRVLVTGHRDKSLRVWNAETFVEQRVITGHQGEPGMNGFTLAFTPDSRLLAASDQNENAIRLWDVSSGKQMATFEGHTEPAYSIALSPNGLWLASGSLDGTARLWEVATGKEVHRWMDDGIWKWVGSVAFSPDGRRLATGLQGSILVWDLRPPGPKVIRPIDELWKDLGSSEPAAAYRALWALVDGGESSIKDLARRFEMKVDDPERIRKLIAGLGSDDLESRERASADLAAVAGPAEGLIADALKGDVAPEVRARLEQILASLDAPLPGSPDLIQRLRALQALERLGAVEAIKSIAEKGPFARLRRDAASALNRLVTPGAKR